MINRALDLGKGNVVVLDVPMQEKIKALVAFADQHVISFPLLLAMANGEVKPVGDDPRYVIQMQNGYRVVFSYEMQVPTQEKEKLPASTKVTFKKVRHLSISIDKQVVPSPIAVDYIAREFGFSPHDSGKVMLWLEPEVNAVNLAEFCE